MPRRYITVAEQQQIIARAGRRAEGGDTTLENLALACGGCNGHKHAKIQAIDPISKSQVPLYHPRQQNWYAHFTWSVDTLKIVGITTTGRATVNALKLNRDGVINLRKLLILAGLHPPHET
jgi:HNH endonuclease